MFNSIYLSKDNYKVRTLAFSPNGCFLATIGVNNNELQSAILWDTKSGKELAQLDTNIDHPGITQVLFSPDSQIVATVQAFSEKVTLWKTPSGEKVNELRIGNVLAFSPDGSFMVTTSFPVCEPDDTFKKSTIEMWSLSGKNIGQIEGNYHYIYDLQISSDGKFLIAIDTPYKERFGVPILWKLSD